MKKLITILLLYSTALPVLFAQPGRDKHEQLIQFSGVVVEVDSLKPVSFCSIMIKKENRGTVSDYFGYFSFVAKQSDTIEFSAVGFKKSRFVIPDSLTTNKYSLIQILYSDTIYLKSVTIYPWPTKEQFKDAFLHTQVPDDQLEIAKKNLEREEIKERYKQTPMDGSGNFKNQMQQHTSKLYYAGQYPPNNLLNPIAWAKFIQAWKNGDFKRKENKYKEPDK